MTGDKQPGAASRFPMSVFGIYFGVLLLMSGFHEGLVLLMNRLAWSEILQVYLDLLYWALTAAALTLYTRRQIQRKYDEPMRRLAQATAQVAKGDFSVYMPTIHTVDKLDYLDLMILDFNKMVEELGSVETLKTDFISNVSHEMKTPVALIQNHAQRLKQGGLDREEQEEYIQTVLDASRRLSSLISNILKLNKLETRTIAPEVQACDLSRQLTECILRFESLWDEKGLDLQVDLEEGALAAGDESLLELVWNNLLSNAIKFTEPGGTVSVGLRTGTEGVTESVRAPGCGMRPQPKAHIFDKFYQGDTSHAAEGNGLGLALARRVVELLGGAITVDSREGEGSVFSVTLPAPPTDQEGGESL